MPKFTNYIMGKEIHSQIQTLRKRGGHFTKAANEVMDLIMLINTKNENPFEKINMTHYGESRIKHCVKYDLPGFVRLVTIQDNGVCLLAYLGDKNDTETWLESKKGLNLAIDPKNNILVPLRISEDIQQPDKRINMVSDYSEGRLFKKLKDYYFKKIADCLTYAQLQMFLEFDSTAQDEEVLEAAEMIENHNYQSVFFDVFLLLKGGDVEQAQNRILQFEQELTLISNTSKSEVPYITSNDQYLNIQELEAEYLKTILETKGWYDWMVFLHPMQKQVVNSDFKGSSRLLGVSGSGKTSVLVHRAIRLAEKYNGKEILIVTLNNSLAKLIESLINHLLIIENKMPLIQYITVTSFWELCRNLIIKHSENNVFTERILNNITDKTGETIDEIWDEFYSRKLNNEDAKVLLPVHQTLLARGIMPQDYIRQEFDWIRSGLLKSERKEYLSIEREGRYIPFMEEDRKIILTGLEFWEEKMQFVGATDYLGLTNTVCEFLSQIEPEYNNILVDEIQDFGTLELKVIRKLVLNGENDLFLCGDIAQQVYNKQHKLKAAGIIIPPEGFIKILKNYRNSREILQAAYCVFDNNVDREKLKSEDFEVLNPEFANFSSPKPFLRIGVSIENEFSSAVEYLKNSLDISKMEKGCIAVCGISIFNLASIAKLNEIPILSGDNDLSQNNIFLSDLEQTKGFEFDKVVIINCSYKAFPNDSLPSEEWFREVSKLYVAMTRAKMELTISYSGKYSQVFDRCKDYFTEDKWSDHNLHIKTNFQLDEIIKPEIIEFDYNITGLDFLYSSKAKGLSKDLQNKLLDFVAGANVTDERSRRIGWKSMEQLKNDVILKKDLPTLSRIFGPVVFKELENIFSHSNLQ